MAQVYFVNAYVLVFFDLHFHWMKRKDEHTGRPAFLAPYIAVHFYVMARDLTSLK